MENILYYCRLNYGNKLELLYDGKEHKYKLDDTLRKLSKRNDKQIKMFEKLIFRQQTYEQIEKSRGWGGKLAQQWGVSHSQTRRWIEKHIAW